ncbi:MAG: serine--tRNA ligase, partial [Patescibacteria group bacterium]
MLDIKFIRENADLVKAAAKKKRLDFDLDKLLTLDEKRLKVMAEVEEGRRQQNAANDGVASAKDPAAREKLIAQMKVVKAGLETSEASLKTLLPEWQALMLQVPNIPDISVPEGETDAQNVELKTVGEAPKFDFAVKDHVELMKNLDWADFERGTKVSGFRGYILKNGGAELSFALWQLALQQLIKAGFTPMIVPSLIKRESLFGTGYLPQGAEDLYKTQDEEYLAGTAEAATMGHLMDEVVSREDLPRKIVAFSPCFRREAGSHGKDTKGLFRVHEFFKVEQVVLCEASHQTSVDWHEQLLANAEAVMQALGLHYRVVTNCAGDLGLGQVKKYDIEVWLPSENKFRETHSISYFHDFQTRRLNIRYRDDANKMNFAHSLNGTAAATPRLVQALVENYQQA